MADDGIYCKFANITARVGANASAVSNLVGWTDGIILDVESSINVATRYDWSTNYAALDAVVKYALMDASACMAAMYVLLYDISGMPSREAETRLDFLNDRYKTSIAMLKEVVTKDFITNAP